MTQEEPIDEALDKIKDMLKLLQDNLFRMVNSKDVIEVERQVADLQKDVAKFVREVDENLAKSGLTKEQIRMLEDGVVPDELKGKFSEPIVQAQALKRQILELQGIVKSEQGIFSEEEPKKKKNGPTSKYRRKTKYRGLDGRNDWKF